VSEPIYAAQIFAPKVIRVRFSLDFEGRMPFFSD